MTTLTPEQIDLLPSEEDVAFYQEHGYYLSPRVFTDEEIEEAVYGTERYYAGERDFLLSSQLAMFEGWQPEDGEGMRLNDYVSLQNRELSTLACHPLIGAIAALLCGSRSIRLWHDQLIYKPPAEPGTSQGIGWHTDRAYWHTCTSRNMITAWIPLQDSDRSIGTLMIVDGSHRWPGHESLRGFHSSELAELERSFSPGGRPVVKVPMNLQRGQVSFHHCLAIHGSGPNLRDETRLSLSIHLQDETNEYQEARDEDGELLWHRNDVLCRKVDGVPDYHDPDLCPVLWATDH